MAGASGDGDGGQGGESDLIGGGGGDGDGGGPGGGGGDGSGVEAQVPGVFLRATRPLQFAPRATTIQLHDLLVPAAPDAIGFGSHLGAGFDSVWSRLAHRKRMSCRISSHADGGGGGGGFSTGTRSSGATVVGPFDGIHGGVALPTSQQGRGLGAAFARVALPPSLMPGVAISAFVARTWGGEWLAFTVTATKVGRRGSVDLRVPSQIRSVTLDGEPCFLPSSVLFDSCSHSLSDS